MVMIDLAIVNSRIVTSGGIILGGVAIEGEKIVAVAKEDHFPVANKVVDAKGNFLLPGIVDPHSHLGIDKMEDPEQGYEQTIRQETISAATGGVTTFFTTPPPPPLSLEDAIRIMNKDSIIDMALHGRLFTDQHLREISKCVALGVISFKSHMIGYPKKGTLPADDGIIYLAFEAMKKLGPPAIEMVHCENYYIINKLQERLMSEGRKDFQAWTDSRPSFTEEEAMRRAMFIAETIDSPLYIPHMSIKEGVGLVAQQKARGFTVVAEVCPHHLTMTKHDKNGWLAKVTNPLREKEDIEALWKGIKDGVIECVGSDHVPYSLKYKMETDIWDIHGAGFQGTATILPVMLSEGVNKGRIPIERIADVCCANPAKVFGIYPQKGAIQVGSDADLVIADLNKEVTVNAPMLHSSSDLTMYEGWRFKGWPIMTISRGEIIMENGEIIAKPGRGKYLHRKLHSQR